MTLWMNTALSSWADDNEFWSMKLVGSIWLPLNPVPASRPRVPRQGKAYYPKTYRKYREDAARLLEVGDMNLEGPIGAIVELIVQRPKTTKLTHPGFDVDNGLKAIFDALQKVGGYFDDDKQIVAVAANKRWTLPEEEPGTRVELYQGHPT